MQHNLKHYHALESRSFSSYKKNKLINKSQIFHFQHHIRDTTKRHIYFLPNTPINKKYYYQEDILIT